MSNNAPIDAFGDQRASFLAALELGVSPLSPRVLLYAPRGAEIPSQAHKTPPKPKPEVCGSPEGLSRCTREAGHKGSHFDGLWWWSA